MNGGQILFLYKRRGLHGNLTKFPKFKVRDSLRGVAHCPGVRMVSKGHGQLLSGAGGLALTDPT